MRLVIDVECNALENPTEIWLIVAKDLDSGKVHIFREVTKHENEAHRAELRDLVRSCTHWVGHNWLGFDYPVLRSLLGLEIKDVWEKSTDTLIISRLYDYSRPKHSIEDYGREFGLEKGKFNDWSKYSTEMEQYCLRDVEICAQIFWKYQSFIDNPDYRRSIVLEHHFQLICNKLHDNGFGFDTERAKRLLEKVEKELNELDKDILEAFPPRLKLVREITPKLTKFGTINRTSIPKKLREQLNDDLSSFSDDAPFCFCEWQDFNPSSHKQIVEVLNQARWKPEEKTKTHVDCEREINRLKYRRGHGDPAVEQELKDLYDKLETLKVTGWKVTEKNLATLPPRAPLGARLLAKRILYESRRRTLTEWLDLVTPEGRIHGQFQGIGAWTHRMSHQHPNMANIPNEKRIDGTKQLLGKEMRSLWTSTKGDLLVGVDAEGIQLRIFAHLIDDPEFTLSLEQGSKKDGTDPHSLNKAILGSVCPSRQAAKRFVYALLLGGGMDRLAAILGCARPDAERALQRLMARYQGFEYLKKSVIPFDAQRGYFIGLDGRRVNIPGATIGERRHLAMSGYLQTGEAVVMKMATLLAEAKFELEGLFSWIVNLVHDEWQRQVENNFSIALRIAQILDESLRAVGEQLMLKCKLAGSYKNDDDEYTIAHNWALTH